MPSNTMIFSEKKFAFGLPGSFDNNDLEEFGKFRVKGYHEKSLKESTLSSYSSEDFDIFTLERFLY